MQQNADLITPQAPTAPFTQIKPGTYTPTAIWKGAVAQRNELGSQLEKLSDQRNDLVNRLHDESITGVDRKGLETRLSDVDARIQTLDKQIAVADQQVAQAAAVPTAVVEPPPPVYHNDGPPEDIILASLFFVFVAFPLTIAFARRIWRRGSAAISAIPNDLMERMSRLDQSVDSIAVEVERIGEGQRFMTRLFTDAGGRAIGAGAAEPVRVPAKEGAPVRARASEQ
jgi:hypothetical protein